MKRSMEVRYPSSANLFSFCKKVLDHKFGGIRIIDQDVGQILGYDPADCSHWKKGKKNVRSIQAMKAIAQHLGVDEQLVVDIATGEVDPDEGFFEYNGYGEFELDAKTFETARKEFLRKNAFSKDKDSELKSHTEMCIKKIDEVVKEILTRIDLQEAPLYLPEIGQFFPSVNFTQVEPKSEESPEVRTDAPPVSYELGEQGVKINLRKDLEAKPYIRFQVAKALASFFLKDVLSYNMLQFKELGLKLNEILTNLFAAKLLAPAYLIRKEIQGVQLSKDIITQLSETFWVSKTFMNRRLKEVLQKPSEI